MNSLINKKTLKIASLESASKRRELLAQFAEMNGFTYENITFESEKELYKSVENNQVDAFLSIDLSVPSAYTSIARFSPDPFYFITTKGNSQVINELNQALTNINLLNPTLSSVLYNRYFTGDTSSLILSTSEKGYIKEKKSINVLLSDGIAPVQYLEKHKAHGIGVDVLQVLSKQTGLRINYIFANDNAEYKKLSTSGDIDMVLGLPYESSIASEMKVTLSDPYITTNLVLITNKETNPSDLSKYKQAVSYHSQGVFKESKTTKIYDSLETLLNAVNKKEADYAYVNPYVYTYYQNKYDYKNITSFNAPEHLRSQYSFGVSENEDYALLSILNKSIRHQQGFIESYIYKNAYVNKGFNFKDFVIDNIVFIVVITLFILLGVILLIRAHYTNKLKMKKSIELEYKRYQMLSDISGEMTFSFDYIHDLLKISSTGQGRIAKNDSIYKFSTYKKSELESNILYLLQRYFQDKKDIICEVRTSLYLSQERWYQISIKIINDSDKTGQTAIYAVGKIVDIQSKKEEEELLKHKSRTDILTNVLNRAGGEEEIKKALDKKTSEGCLIMIDLDNFKPVNDTYGHLEGDKVLIELAQMLTKTFENAIIARLGGDEFIIYSEGIDKEKVQHLCESALSSIHTLSSMNEKSFQLSMSIGIAFTSETRDYESLLKIADMNLYEVKRNGKDGYQM